MAESTRYGHVIVAATGDTITGPLDIIAIKVVGGASGATVNFRDVNNVVLFKSVVGNNSSEFCPFDDGLELRAQAYNLNISAGAADVYIYIR